MRPARPAIALLLGSALALSACSAPAASSEKSFTVGLPSIGVSHVPFLAAMDELRAQGYTIETPEFADSDLAIEATSKGEIQFSLAGAAPIPISRGVDLTVFLDRVGNEWAFYGIKDIGSCDDLEGMRVAIHAEVSTSTSMLRDWLAAECPDVEPQYVVIPGSPNRYTALVTDQVDASPVELPDAVRLLAEEGDRFHEITSFAASLPDLHPGLIYGNPSFMEANPETVKDIIRAVLEQHRKVAGDAAYLAEITREYYPEADDASLDEIAQAYVDLGLFDVNGGLTPENLQFTIDFYTNGGFAEPGLTVDEMADLSYLADVLEEIGRE